MAFISSIVVPISGPALSCSRHRKFNSVLASSDSSHVPPSPRIARRSFLALSASVLTLFHLSSSSYATQWSKEDLCSSCEGHGTQPCSLCSGTGIFSIDDSVVQQELTCPNCSGKGSVQCPACIGLGLSDTRGILRDGTYFFRLQVCFFLTGSQTLKTLTAFGNVPAYA